MSTSIVSEPNTNILIPYLTRERERTNPKEQMRTQAANAAGPRRCRLLHWLTNRQSRRSETESIQRFYQELLTNILLREKTKRILIREKQHIDILSSQHPVPDEIARDLRWPFDDHIYIEVERALPSLNPSGRINLYQGIIILAGPEPRWSLSIQTCTEVDWIGGVVGQIDLQKNAYRVFNEDLNQNEFQPEEFNPYVRLLAYMTAKGIEIVEHPTSRNTRRLLERKALPNPWHVIKVEPKFVVDEYGEEREETNRRHSYRYDVAGHIRFGRHRLRDGSHRSTREWIRPHQRGLANSNYIPASRRYSNDLPDEIEEILE